MNILFALSRRQHQDVEDPAPERLQKESSSVTLNYKVCTDSSPLDLVEPEFMLAFHMLVTGTNFDILELLQVLLAMEELLVVTGSVGNPNTLNFDSDPDTENLPNLDPDPELCYKCFFKLKKRF